MPKKKLDLPEELNNKLTALTDLQKQKAEIEKGAIDLLKGTLKQLLVDVPELEGISWCQYVPGFNDGEPCEFSIMGLEVKFAGVSEKDMEQLEEDCDSTEGYAPINDQMDILQYGELKARYGEKLFKYIDKVESVIYSLEDCVKSAFGENARVVVTRSGIEVEDYDCGY